MSLKCANCLNMKVTYVKLGGHSYKTHKAECKYNHHAVEKDPTKRTHERAWAQMWLVKDVTPPNPYDCDDYVSMQDEIIVKDADGVEHIDLTAMKKEEREFIATLPPTKDDYRAFWR